MRAKSLVFSMILLGILVSSVSSQSKVGTTAFNFLGLSPSAHANGMGGAGVALVDNESWYFNPGLSGLTQFRRVVSRTPYNDGDLPADVDHYSYGLQFPVLSFFLGRQSKFDLSVGFRTLRLEMDDIEVSSYEQVPTGETFDWRERSNCYTFAAGYRGPVHVGIGLTAKDIKQSGHDLKITGRAYDYGLAVRMPFHIPLAPDDDAATLVGEPTVAFAVTNTGDDIEILGENYSLPRSTRYGSSVYLAWRTAGEFSTIDRLSLTPAFEIEEPKIGDQRSKVGIELGVWESLYGRLGRMSRAGYRDDTSWGYSVDLAGITKAITHLAMAEGSLSWPLDLLVYRMHIRYTESHTESGELNAASTYRSVTVNIAL